MTLLEHITPEALSTIASLIIIEGLLSVDNILGIASLAKGLPEHQQKKAIRLGMVGAYVFRILALLAASWLIKHTWIRWVGAGYLVWLMCSHLVQHSDADGDGKEDGVPVGFGTILLQISLMDLMLSIDNVITAVTLAPKDGNGQPIMWPIFAGVTFSILALQLLAPTAMKLLNKYPVLGPAAFVLLGYVGGILMVEEGFHLHIEAWQKFIGIGLIIAVALLYGSKPGVKTALQPVFRAIHPLMFVVAKVGEVALWPVKALAGLLSKKTA
jgi:tellurite resistance protein TerC